MPSNIILLNHNEKTRVVEEEERNRFLKDLLEQMGVPTDEIWGEALSLSSEQKISLRELLTKFNIIAVYDDDGGMDLYVDKELVGRWFKPTYKLKKDYQALDPKKSLYLEMTICYESVFDDQ